MSVLGALPRLRLVLREAKALIQVGWALPVRAAVEAAVLLPVRADRVVVVMRPLPLALPAVLAHPAKAMLAAMVAQEPSTAAGVVEARERLEQLRSAVNQQSKLCQMVETAYKAVLPELQHGTRVVVGA